MSPMAQLEETELLRAADGCAAARDAELRVDVLRVCPDGVQREDELPRDVGAVEVAPEQPEDIDLPLAERFDETVPGWRRFRNERGRSDERVQIGWRAGPPPRGLQETGHRSPLVEEHADVPLRLGDGHRLVQRRERARTIPRGVARQGDDDEDREAAPAARWRRRAAA